MAHPVAQVLIDRRSARSRPGARRDAHRVGLAVEGGAVRGVVSAGMLVALEELGFRDAFDVVYGSSAGSFNAVLPVAHLDLSPSNVIVQERESGDGSATVAHVYLVDFGENYLLTQDVGGGRVGAGQARFVAPELLHSRVRRERSGREDVFSLGQLLLALAGFAGGDGGFIPTKLYEEAPFLGPIVEDLVDRSPDRRLLLMDGVHDPDVADGAGLRAGAGGAQRLAAARLDAGHRRADAVDRARQLPVLRARHAAGPARRARLLHDP
jgi:hypothetical protein